MNDTKFKFMILRSKKQRKQALKELEKEPMMMGGRKINHAVNEKYLGDFVSELGCKQSIDDTIKYRIQKLTSKANDILLIEDAPQRGAKGGGDKMFYRQAWLTGSTPTYGPRAQLRRTTQQPAVLL